MLIVFVNLLLWTLAYYYVKKKYGSKSIGTVLILLYTLISWCIPILYFSSSATDYFSSQLTLIPFIYLYVVLLMAIRPLYNYSPRYISKILLLKRKYLNLICFFFSIFTISSLIQIIPSFKEGLVGLILDSSSASNIYATSTYDRMNQSNNAGYNVFAIFSNIAIAIIPLLFYTYLLQDKKNKIILILLTLSLLIPPLNGIAKASRLNIISSFFIFILLGIFFYPYLQLSIKVKLKKGLLFFSIFFIAMFIIITIGRSSGSNSSSMGYGFLRYFAEGPIVFDNYCMDAGGTRDGEYTFAFQHVLDRKSQPNEKELRNRYRHLKVDSSRFYTFVGDFVLDYGPIKALLVMGIIFLLVYNKSIIKKRTLKFSQIILLFILLQYCCGFYQYRFSMKSGNLTLFILLVMYIGISYLQIIRPNWFVIKNFKLESN